MKIHLSYTGTVGGTNKQVFGFEMAVDGDWRKSDFVVIAEHSKLVAVHPSFLNPKATLTEAQHAALAKVDFGAWEIDADI